MRVTGAMRNNQTFGELLNTSSKFILIPGDLKYYCGLLAISQARKYEKEKKKKYYYGPPVRGKPDGNQLMNEIFLVLSQSGTSGCQPTLWLF